MSVNEKMTALADAIRSKTGQTGKLSLDAMTAAVEDISTGVRLPELTNEGVASDLLAGKQLIDAAGDVVTGTIPTKTSSDLTANGPNVTIPAGYYASQATKSVSTSTQATPSITVDGYGKITASATQIAGYVASGTKTATKQLTTQAGITVTPSTSDITAVKSGYYTTGSVYVKGDSNLVAENIKSGVSIFGVSGSYNGSTEDLGSIITELETKVATLNTTLDGKASGGGSFETCTVTINVTGVASSIQWVVATTVENGNVSQYSFMEGDMVETVNVTIENVLCGSAIYALPNFYIPGWTISGEGLEVIHGSGRGMVLKAPTIGGTSVSITIYETL